MEEQRHIDKPAILRAIKKDWRPKNWEQIRKELAAQPMVWSPSGPNLSPGEQIVEATASRILEEVEYVNTQHQKAE